MQTDRETKEDDLLESIKLWAAIFNIKNLQTSYELMF